jgi:high-affinity nickel-transport protein
LDKPSNILNNSLQKIQEATFNMVGFWLILAISIPTMILLGLRHGLDVDHISAVDSLIRLYNATKKARWVGTGFSVGHMISVLAEMVFVIYTVGSLLTTESFNLLSGFLGAGALAVIGFVNIYSMKKWGKTGPAILAGKILTRTGRLGPYGSALITGIVFGMGFDTTTQISAISLSAATSATEGIQIALMMVGFFGVGMISMDTLNSILLRSVFWRIFQTRAFKYMSYGLSAVAVSVALMTGYETVTNSEIIPKWAGPALAVAVVSSSFAYACWTKKKKTAPNEKTNNKETK